MKYKLISFSLALLLLQLIRFQVKQECLGGKPILVLPFLMVNVHILETIIVVIFFGL